MSQTRASLEGRYAIDRFQAYIDSRGDSESPRV